ncbi:hypothetical protein [Futiania mangrovi]|uniref:Uncharacterized protein n=1 Tax=Futiania mangrovi TaxID=2959716 RepID=A0A9J6PCG6_9PROT|nr:hypothetical protein [Futiania mangrovii]MCP1335488.1 hypothetical protein [Futiania mangrovii]
MGETGAPVWVVIPAGQQASGGWIDDTLKARAVERGMMAAAPLTGDFPRQRVEAVAGGDPEARVRDLFERRGWTDGLPIVAPTTVRVRRMIAGGHLSANEVLGAVEPLKGLATVEKVAANAVMAGCKPAYFPVVLAAVDALLDPEFNLNGVQTTDENVAPLLIVSGPVVERIGLNASFGALGPGWAANATIGRALRLVMLNLGGGRAGLVSFAGLGQAGRYTLCLAENAALSPWPAIHTEAGLPAEASAVTLTRAETVINVTGGLEEIATVMGTAASAFQIMWSGRPTVILAPATAAELAAKGMSKDDVRAWLHTHGRWPAESWERSWFKSALVAEGRWKDWVLEGAARGAIPPTKAPEDIVIVVAGGDVPIPQHAYCPSWGSPPARITREVRLPGGG